MSSVTASEPAGILRAGLQAASAGLGPLRMAADIESAVEMLRFRALRRDYYDTLWRTAARRIGAEYMEWRYGYRQLRRDGLTTVVSLYRVMLDDHLTLAIMGNKVLTYDLLAAKGCRIPRYCVFEQGRTAEAERFLAGLGGPAVVKPASGTGGGRGVTTGVKDVAGLRKAARYASRFCTSLLLEEQVTGSSYRLLYLDGEYLDAVRRDPPVVVGDGQSTIRRLVRAENVRRRKQRPVSALSPLLIDRDCRNYLAEHGLSPWYRPPAGAVIQVKRAVNENTAQQNHNVRTSVHPEIVALGANLVRDFGVRLAGLDLICSDIGKPLAETGGLFNEINTTPGLHHHALLADPAAGVPVAERVLEHLFAKRQGVMVL